MISYIVWWSIVILRYIIDQIEVHLRELGQYDNVSYAKYSLQIVINQWMTQRIEIKIDILYRDGIFSFSRYSH